MSDLNFPEVWVGPGIPGIRDYDATYAEAPLRDVPQVTVGDDLSWLEPLHPLIDAEMQRFRPDARRREKYTKKAADILSQATEIGLRLPAAFKELIQSDVLQDRFPSATACYFDLPEKIVRAPFGLSGHIIRFLNDQQICVLWYLHLPKQGEPSVLASYPVEDADFLEELKPENTRAVTDAARATRIVAHSLGEFLYRYWIENSIWMKKWAAIDLSAREDAYVRSLKSSTA